MTYPRTVTAELLDFDGSVIGGDPLANAFGVNFYDEWNGPGRGQITLSLSEAGAAQLLPGRYVDCKVEGVSQLTFKIEGNPQYDVIDRGEEHDQVVTVQGRGWGISFDEAATYPGHDPTVRLDTTWRLFNFASPDFPNAGGWPAAVEIYEYLDGVSEMKRRQQAPDGFLYPSPIGFPWALSPNNYDVDSPPGVGYIPTYWIWSEAGTGTEEYEVGWCFFRNTITVVDGVIMNFDITADNYFTFFVEGVPLLGETEDHFVWRGWKPGDVGLPDGTYSIACVVENIQHPNPSLPPDANPAGFLMAAYTVDGNQDPLTNYRVSDDSWICEFVPITGYWPGWTPGQIVDTIRAEASARGEITVFNSDTFTDDLDSNGDPWRPLDAMIDSPYIPEFSVEIGTTMLDALNKLHDEGLINWHVQAGTLVLDVYRGREPAPSSAATLAAGVNIRSLDRGQTSRFANALLVQWEQGYVTVEDIAAIAAYGTRVTDFFSSDATSEAEAESVGRTELIKRAQEGLPAISVEVEPVDTNDCPYEGYDLGDWVTVPALDGMTEDVRVLSINCQQDALGYAQWTLELNRKLNVPERRNEQLLRQIGGRSQVIRGTVN